MLKLMISVVCIWLVGVGCGDIEFDNDYKDFQRFSDEFNKANIKYWHVADKDSIKSLL
jgi:hypothetical protein